MRFSIGVIQTTYPENAALSASGMQRIIGQRHEMGHWPTPVNSASYAASRTSPAQVLLGVEPGRIALSHASPALLAALPGMSAEAAAVVVETRARGGDLDNLLLLGTRLSSTARDALRRGYVDLTRLTTPEPEGWFVISRASPPGSRVVAEVELKLVRAGMRAAVVRRRTQWR